MFSSRKENRTELLDICKTWTRAMIGFLFYRITDILVLIYALHLSKLSLILIEIKVKLNHLTLKKSYRRLASS